MASAKWQTWSVTKDRGSAQVFSMHSITPPPPPLPSPQPYDPGVIVIIVRLQVALRSFRKNNMDRLCWQSQGFDPPPFRLEDVRMSPWNCSLDLTRAAILLSFKTFFSVPGKVPVSFLLLQSAIFWDWQLLNRTVDSFSKFQFGNSGPDQITGEEVSSTCPVLTNTTSWISY